MNILKIVCILTSRASSTYRTYYIKLTMMTPLVLLPRPDSAERSRLLSVNYLRERALERLYARREAVDDLIRSLENYSQAQDAAAEECLEFSSGRKCS